MLLSVFVVVYSNHSIEEWGIKGIFAGREDAEALKEHLEQRTDSVSRRSDVWDRFTVEEHNVS